MAEGADGEDLPPPLEDMSEQLEKMKQHRMKLLQPSSELSKDKTKVKAAPSADQPSSEHSKDKTKVETAPSAGRGKSSEGSGFGGLRKGFLSGSSSKTPTVAGDLSSKTRPRSKSDKPKSNGTDNPANLRTSSGVDDIIHPKVSGKSSGLEFPEVQEAMKESFPFLNTEKWMSDDLLAKIEKDPVLSEAFQDPVLSQALLHFQTNPQQALAAVKDDPRVLKFLQSFCALMGDHFTALGEMENKNSPAPVSEIVSQEEAQMREILAKPEVKQVLDDPRIQNLIQTLKSNPTTAQQLIRSSNPDFTQKIKVLIDNGLLAIQ